MAHIWEQKLLKGFKIQYNKLFTSASLIIIMGCLLQADEYGTIVTSRPDAANPTSAVPSGFYQFEIGTRLLAGPGMDTTFSIPALLRMGVYKNTELQVAYASEYLSLGVLYGGISFLDGLENSIILTTSLSENNDSLTEYSAYLPISYSFNNGFSVWGEVAGTVINTDDRDPVISYSLAVGNSLFERTSWFFESYQSRLKDQDAPPFSINYGFTYLSADNVQFDISMGVLLEKDDKIYKESSRYIELGFSLRLPY